MKLTLLLLRYPSLNFVFSIIILLVLRGIFIHEIYAEESTLIEVPIFDNLGNIINYIGYEKVPLEKLLSKEAYANYEAKLHPDVTSFEKNVKQRLDTAKTLGSENLALEGLLPNMLHHPMYSNEKYRQYMDSLHKLAEESPRHKNLIEKLIKDYSDKYSLYNHNAARQRFLNLIVFREDIGMEFPFDTYSEVAFLPKRPYDSLHPFVKNLIKEHNEKELFPTLYLPEHLTLMETYRIYEYMSDKYPQVYFKPHSDKILSQLIQVSKDTRDPLMIHSSVCFELKSLAYQNKIHLKLQYPDMYAAILYNRLYEVSQVEPKFEYTINQSFFKGISSEDIRAMQQLSERLLISPFSKENTCFSTFISSPRSYTDVDYTKYLSHTKFNSGFEYICYLDLFEVYLILKSSLVIFIVTLIVYNLRNK